MAFVYVRNLDKMVLSVRDTAQRVTPPAGVTEYDIDWSGLYSNLKWSKLKTYRNDDGTYSESEVLHPDDDDGLF